MKESTVHIDLENVYAISRGDQLKTLKYLRQFNELIPQRLTDLKEALNEGDRISVRQILHKMSPQLQFFGIHKVATPIQRLEYEHESLPFNELTTLVKDIIHTLENALHEVSTYIKTNFDDVTS